MVKRLPLMLLLLAALATSALAIMRPAARASPGATITVNSTAQSATGQLTASSNSPSVIQDSIAVGGRPAAAAPPSQLVSADFAGPFLSVQAVVWDAATGQWVPDPEGGDFGVVFTGKAEEKVVQVALTQEFLDQTTYNGVIFDILWECAYGPDADGDGYPDCRTVDPTDPEGNHPLSHTDPDHLDVALRDFTTISASSGSCALLSTSPPEGKTELQPVWQGQVSRSKPVCLYHLAFHPPACAYSHDPFTDPLPIDKEVTCHFDKPTPDPQTWSLSAKGGDYFEARATATGTAGGDVPVSEEHIVELAARMAEPVIVSPVVCANGTCAEDPHGGAFGEVVAGHTYTKTVEVTLSRDFYQQPLMAGVYLWGLWRCKLFPDSRDVDGDHIPDCREDWGDLGGNIRDFISVTTSYPSACMGWYDGPTTTSGVKLAGFGDVVLDKNALPACLYQLELSPPSWCVGSCRLGDDFEFQQYDFQVGGAPGPWTPAGPAPTAPLAQSGDSALWTNLISGPMPPPAVGGIAELPDVGRASSQEAAPMAGGSGWSARSYAAVAGALAGAILISGGAAWYARRRWLRQRS